MPTEENEFAKIGTRFELRGTVDRDLFGDFNKILEEEQNRAIGADRAKPDRSAVLEMLLRKGIKSYRSEK